jgi:hypothetical protein
VLMSRMARCCFRHYIARGVIIRLLYLLCVYWHRLMNMLRIYSRSCTSFTSDTGELTDSADLELTVSLLVQIDKLVMLIESPVFLSMSSSCLCFCLTAILIQGLRLQLLEPDKYPFLPKCLYGLLMILPQSSAFVSLRARLMAVHSGGYVPSQPKAAT